MKVRDAAAVVLVRERSGELEAYWVERAAKSAFLPGYRAFVGGRVETADAAVTVSGEMPPGIDAVTAVAALRELFEETGVLLARLPAEVSAGALARARHDLGRGQRFADVLDGLGATLDLSLLRPAGRWVTPAFAPRRFDTRFLLATLPPGQMPVPDPGEIASGAWVRPADAVLTWRRAEALLPPPVLHILRALEPGLGGDLEARLAHDGAEDAPRTVDRMEFVPGIVLVPLQSETIAPATHTNAYIVGRDRAVLLDPGSADPTEIEVLARAIEELSSEGVRVERIVLTHHHRDHVAGSDALRARLGVKVWAHADAAARLAGSVHIDGTLEDGARLELGEGYAMVAHHTPGHAPGHLSFFEERTSSLLAGDNVVGIGTVIIDPDEGDMDAYLASLERLCQIGARAVFGGHGPALAHAEPAIRSLIAHRLGREAKLVQALRAGTRDLAAITAAAYADTPAADPALARRQALAHLVCLERRGRVRRDGEGFVIVARS